MAYSVLDTLTRVRDVFGPEIGDKMYRAMVQIAPRGDIMNITSESKEFADIINLHHIDPEGARNMMDIVLDGLLVHERPEVISAKVSTYMASRNYALLSKIYGDMTRREQAMTAPPVRMSPYPHTTVDGNGNTTITVPDCDPEYKSRLATAETMNNIGVGLGAVAAVGAVGLLGYAAFRYMSDDAA